MRIPQPAGDELCERLFSRGWATSAAWCCPGAIYLGIFDLLLVTALAEYWRRRGGSYLIAVVPGLLGLFLLPSIVILVTAVGNLPLIPFLTAGWLGSESLHRYLGRQAAP